jgi:hypothetical protein
MSHHDLIHLALSPFSLFNTGVSNKMGNTYTEDGLPNLLKLEASLSSGLTTNTWLFR